MGNPVPLAEIWRGPFLESVHLGHAVIVDDSGQIVQAWGDPTAVVLPRSLKKLGNLTFRGCTGLASVTMPEDGRPPGPAGVLPVADGPPSTRLALGCLGRLG